MHKLLQHSVKILPMDKAKIARLMVNLKKREEDNKKMLLIEAFRHYEKSEEEIRQWSIY